MTAHQIPHLFCDGTDRDGDCGREWIGSTASTIPSARKAAAASGWQVQRQQGVYRDLCPDCGDDQPAAAGPEGFRV